MARYVNAPEIKKLCEAIACKYPTKFSDVFPDRIHFVWDDSPKEKTKYAYVRKISDLEKYRNPEFDFYLVISRAMTINFSQAQLNALICHEISHIGPRDIDKEGNEKVSLVKHDFEEFYSIVGAFGLYWTMNRNCVDPLKEDVTFAYIAEMNEQEVENRTLIAARAA